MTQHNVVLPRTQTPSLDFSLIGGGNWSLAEQKPEHFTLVVFYRGYHCPICKKQLQELLSMKEDFAKTGINVVAVSADDSDRAEKSRDEWELDGLDLGYGIGLDKALEWGLHVSAGRPDSSEPEHFSEPGLFMVRPDGTLYFSSVQTMPFARPQLSDILGAAKFVIEKDYPARGELVSL